MVRSDGLLKYPRTPHLEGSRLQPGDSDHDQVKLSTLAGKHCVIEEKLDGANAGLSFSDDATLRQQSRGHFLLGGSRDKHFNLLKRWSSSHEDALFDVLRDRYIMFGEWMYAKHSMFYDALPHLFLEFDIYDKNEGIFLSTPRRHDLLSALPVVSVPVLASGPMPSCVQELRDWVGPSVARTPQWRDSLSQQARRAGLDVDRVLSQTDQDDNGEGLYIKIEDDDQVLARFKFVRATFTQTLLDQGDHWLNRPVVPNILRPGVDMFSPTIDKTWPTPIRRMSPRSRR